MTPAAPEVSTERIRLDKWLWAARFFKTRSQATEAVSGGKVHLNEMRVKAARAVRVGDTLTIQRGREQFTVVVAALSRQRGPAREAALLYQETQASMRRRQQQNERRRLQRPTTPSPGRRPTKQERRHITRLQRLDS